jgi:V/A-type H+/Na+-transporting ATPase subunit E
MAIEEIISRIKQDAHSKADAKVAEARQSADRFKKEFEKELERTKESLQRELEAGIQSKVGIVISGSRKDVRDSVLRVKESIIQDCINESLAELRNLPDEQYAQLLMTLIQRGREQVGGSGTGQCLVTLTRSKDRELLGTPSGFEITDEIVPGSGGVVIHSADRKLRVNNTFEGILQRKRGEIRNLAARALFSQ